MKGYYKDKYPTPNSPNVQMLQCDEKSDEVGSQKPEEFENEADDKNDVFHSFGFLQNRSVQTAWTESTAKKKPEKKARLIDENFILLDSESTVCTFRNRKLLKNIRVHSGGKSAEVHTNGGTQTSVLVADYTTLDIPVWLNDESLANILSLAVVRKKFRVTMDTDIMPAIHVHLPDGSIMNFHEMSNGLYCHDIRGTTKTSIPSYSFLNTVENNLKLYTRREQLMANKARILYRNSPFPGPQRFINLLDRQYFRNYPVTSTDAKRAIHIWGKI